MKICICRNISDTEIKNHLDAHPRLLGATWDIVSFEISNKPIQCGICTEAATTCMTAHEQNQKAPAPKLI